jgi:glucose-6-phosphate isomerase
MDGPDDKVYQLIFVKNYHKDPAVPKEPYILPFIGGKRVSEVMEAEYKGTVFALKSRKRPMVLMELERLSERELGELFMSYMVATVITGRLMGVNPYGQPAVEIGKRAAERELLKGEEVRN